MRKTNTQIELECAENWRENYMSMTPIPQRKLASIKAHIRELRRKMRGVVSA